MMIGPNRWAGKRLCGLTTDPLQSNGERVAPRRWRFSHAKSQDKLRGGLLIDNTENRLGGYVDA